MLDKRFVQNIFSLPTHSVIRVVCYLVGSEDTQKVMDVELEENWYVSQYYLFILFLIHSASSLGDSCCSNLY